MIRVKICGITSGADARMARAAGADFLGLVFAASPRQVTAEGARDIMRAVAGFDGWVGVFVDEKKRVVEETAEGLGIRYLQFHGEESPATCAAYGAEGFQVIKAFRVRDTDSLRAVEEYDTAFVLLDGFANGRAGGTGASFDWGLLRGKRFSERLFLAGGLRPESVEAAVREVAPFAVDVSSGVESGPGVKSEEKVREFVRRAREACRG
jgi:phosphoribosylanthranilate isomerase